MSPISAALASSPAAKADRPRPRLRLGHALTALVLVAVLSTALVVHVSWMWTASRNVETVVASLNAETARAVRRELDAAFRGAEGASDIVRTILFQGAVKPDDEVKREFVFLSVLRSSPAVSWVGFGFPDGRFFGSHALDDGRIEMVEIGATLANGSRTLRRDRYRPIPGDIFFEERTKSDSQYVAPGTGWFRQAAKAKAPVWSMVDILPSGFEPAAVVSTRLDVFSRFQGVLMVTLNLKRVSAFLGALDIARNGGAVIVDERGIRIASSRGTSADAADPLSEALSSGMAARTVTSGGEIFYTTATPLDFNGWKLLTAVRRSAFTGDIDRNTRRLLFAIAALALIGAATAALFANLSFARPIRAIAGELRHIENFSLGEVRRIPTWLRELDDLSGALKRMAGSLKAFGLYVPADVVRTLLDLGVEPKPGGELREITVMFADLPGFTKLTEQHGAAVTPFLTDFLTLAIAAVHAEGGTVDKFIGDCIMAMWNAPAPAPDHALRACRAANRIRALMRELPRPDGRVDGPRIRIGLDTGEALVGNVGSTERLSYTAIGDVVNVASRLEGLSRDYGVEVLASETTMKACGGSMVFHSLGDSPVKGRKGMIHVFELLH